MMSMTHITIGIASALAVCRPDSLQSFLPVLAGASAGSAFCDLDCRTRPKKRDALFGRIVAAGLSAAALFIDYEIGQPMMKYINSLTTDFLAALFAFLVCGGVAAASGQRGFSHSLFAMAVYTASLSVMLRPVAAPFMTAFLSHLLLDLMNRKPVKIFWPFGRGICLRWFYADRTANTLIMLAGAAWTGAELFRLKSIF